MLPEAVSAKKDGFLAVSYDALIAPLVESIKELHAKLVALEAKIAEQFKDHDDGIVKLEETVKQLQSANYNQAKEISTMHQEINVLKSMMQKQGSKP